MRPSGRTLLITSSSRQGLAWPQIAETKIILNPEETKRFSHCMPDVGGVDFDMDKRRHPDEWANSSDH